MRSATAVLLFVLVAGPALAQAPPPAVDLGSPVVEALEVVAKPPGPALWKASMGEAEVTILGGVTPLPHALVWDAARVRRALDGADVLLVPPKPRIGPIDIVKFVLGGRGKLRLDKDQPLESRLPEPLRDRFVAARMTALKGADRYARWKPFVAGFMLVADYREAAGLSSAKPGSTVEKLARAQHVKVRSVADYRVAPLLGQAKAISEAESLACLGDAVDQVERESRQARALAEAWAAGDLAGVRANYGPAPLERCLQQVPSVAALIEKGTAGAAAAILSELTAGEKAVAVVDLNFLLRPNGVLDRLQAAGASITVPPG